MGVFLFVLVVLFLFFVVFWLNELYYGWYLDDYVRYFGKGLLLRFEWIVVKYYVGNIIEIVLELFCLK